MSVSVLSISLGGIISKNNFSGAFNRQIKYAKSLKDYYVVTQTYIHVDGKLENLYVDNIHFYPTNANNRVDNFFKSFSICDKIIKNNKIDIITCADPVYTGLLGLFLSKKYRIPLDISIMSDIINNPHYLKGSVLKNRFNQCLAKLVLKQSDSIRVSTLAEVKKLQAIYGEKKVYLGRFYVDIEPYEEFDSKSINQIRLKLLENSKDILVLYVGRLAKQKSIDVLIKSAHIVVNTLPQVLFAIVGYGTEREYLENLVIQLGIEENVKFLGGIPFQEIPLYFKACDLFAITSHHEGTCMVILEAALAERPIVATNFAGALDLLEEFEDTALCEINNSQQVAEKILYALNNPDYRQNMGQQLRIKVLNEFDPDRVSQGRSQKWIDLSNQLVSS
jgi:glycosyltransferase involved in cell wall biosynthesis